MKADIQSVHFTADQKLIDFIQLRLDKLQKLNDQIVDTSVILKLENTGQVKDKIAEFIVHIPGNKLVASSSSKSFEQSVDESIDAIARQIKKVKGKMRDSAKSARNM